MKAIAGTVLRVATAGLIPALMLSVSSPTVRLPDDPAMVTSAAALGPFSRRQAMDHVRKLAGDIGVRVRATRGETRGATYIAETFRDLGYRVFVQKFSVDSKTSRNV